MGRDFRQQLSNSDFNGQCGEERFDEQRSSMLSPPPLRSPGGRALHTWQLRSLLRLLHLAPSQDLCHSPAPLLAIVQRRRRRHVGPMLDTSRHDCEIGRGLRAHEGADLARTKGEVARALSPSESRSLNRRLNIAMRRKSLSPMPW